MNDKTRVEWKEKGNKNIYKLYDEEHIILYIIIKFCFVDLMNFGGQGFFSLSLSHRASIECKNKNSSMALIFYL